MELKIITPQDSFLKEVEFNFQEIKQELSIRLEKYRGLTYTEQEIKKAKSDRATLNKFKAALEDRRKEIKKMCLEPYERFEKKIKEITVMVGEPISEIDKQVKVFEDKAKSEKKEILEGVYNESIGNLKEILPFEKIWNDRWLNATYNLGQASNDIAEAIQKVEKDLEVINTLDSEFKLQAKDKYLNTLDVSEALRENARLEEQKARISEYEKTVNAKEIEVEKTQEMTSIEVAQEHKEVEVIQEELTILDFRVWVTKEQKSMLREFLTSNKIKYGRVE